MARETKAGLLMIMLLCGVFSFMVYKRMHRPSTAMAQQNPVAAELEAGQPDGADSAETAESASAAADPFVADAGGFAEPDAIIRATAPAPIPDDAEVPRRNAAEPERDPFGASVESPPSKPRLPTRQDPKRHLTTFEQTYVERRGGGTREHRFDLTFRTLSVRQMTRQLERAGFHIDAVLGDYRGRPWDDRADVWIIMAKKR